MLRLSCIRIEDPHAADQHREGYRVSAVEVLPDMPSRVRSGGAFPYYWRVGPHESL